MNRRDFLKATAVTALAPSLLLRPAPRRFDLQTWCRNDGIEHPRYNMETPFQQADFVYATDARACIRVAPASADAVIGKQNLPPAAGLPWWEQLDRPGWRSLPQNPRIITAQDWCLACDGTGVNAPRNECHFCEGFGCKQCRNSGWLGAGDCAACLGDAKVVMPSIVVLGAQWLDIRLWKKVSAFGDGEYRTPADHTTPVMVRTHGAEALVMPLDKQEALKRIRNVPYYALG